MKPILYGAPLSPFVRKIRLQLAFKQVDYDSKMIVPYATPDDYQALNPLRRVPALTLGDDTLADSAVIAQYFDKDKRGFGMLMNAELTNARKLSHNPAKPVTAIIGGAKVSDKIQNFRAI